MEGKSEEIGKGVPCVVRIHEGAKGRRMKALRRGAKKGREKKGFEKFRR